MTSPTETEVKLPAPADLTEIRSRIESLGFHVSAQRVFEANTTYDTPAQDLRRGNMLLRLRQAGNKAVITWKGVPEPGAHKARPEIETTVGALEPMEQILRQLGYTPVFRYEKYRTEFVADDRIGTVTLDETPIGNFLELEGPGDWIDSTAKCLGFSQSDYILESYGRLYLAECERRGVEPSHMVFAS